MKIVFVFNQFLPNIGGTAIPMYHYAKELTKRGHSVTVYTSNTLNAKPAKLREEEKIDGILVKRFRLLPSPVPSYQIFLTPSVIPSLVMADADVIHVFGLFPSFLLIVPCLIAKIRRVALVLYPQYNPNRVNLYSGKIKRAMNLFFDKVIGVLMAKMADYVIALTRAEVEYWKTYGITNISVVYEGITIESPPSKQEILEFREGWGLKESEKIVLAVGRVASHKGLDFLIRSLPLLKKNFPELKLVVVGPDVGYLSTCVALCQQLSCRENVVFAGAVDNSELSCAYEIADIVVAPSRYEAYGRTVVEAWSHKKAVIVTRDVALSELILSETGVVIDSGDIKALAHEIKRLLQDGQLAAFLGKNGYEIVKELTWEKTADKIENLYSIALHRRLHD